MIASMFNLDHRIAELRPTEAELRIARQLRTAAAPAARTPRHGDQATRRWTGGPVAPGHATRPAAY